jgi:hypothetical protein
MALSWPAKAPSAVRKYTWAPVPDQPIDSVSVAVTGTATVSSDVYGDTVTFTVTGGADGVVQVFTLTATSGTETIVETAYLPIETSTNKLGNTVRDVCLFGLRKVVGIAEEPDADELADAIERLNDMVAMWRETGADMGLELPLLEADALLISDAGYSALKFNLRNALHDFYGEPLTQAMVMEARSALAQVKNSMIVHNAPDYF